MDAAEQPVTLIIDADPGRLNQALTNLVANALRHTPPVGTIQVRADGLQTAVRIVVQDSGEGIHWFDSSLDNVI